MTPLILYIVVASVYLGITIWSLYVISTLYVVVTDSMCNNAKFVDTVNYGSLEGDSDWVGVQNIGEQLEVFSRDDESAQ